jgi:hypothetical protein
VIAAADPHRSARVILATTVATLLVFWVARVHAEISAAAQQVQSEGRLGHYDSTAADARGPGGIGPFLLLATLGLLDQEVAVRLALLNEVGQLLGWGIAVGRRLGCSRSASLLAGLVDGTLGVVIVGLKVLLQN